MHYADYKSIISADNNINVYRGCSHGCVYCDSRSECYQFKHDFEDIEVKRNAAEILDGQLRRKRQKGMITTGAMCDPYLHLEADLNVTRDCLGVIERRGFGVTILTKSALVMRDIDILKRINSNAKVVVGMTLTTFDEGLCKKIEPNVSTTRERVEALAELNRQGILTGAVICPLLPFINDTEQNLLGILNYCSFARVSMIHHFGKEFGVTLRAGDREYFYKFLDKFDPEIKQKYIKTFGNSYQCFSPNTARLEKIYADFCRKNGILTDLKRIWQIISTLETDRKQLSIFD